MRAGLVASLHHRVRCHNTTRTWPEYVIVVWSPNMLLGSRLDMANSGTTPPTNAEMRMLFVFSKNALRHNVNQQSTYGPPPFCSGKWGALSLCKRHCHQNKAKQSVAPHCHWLLFTVGRHPFRGLESMIVTIPGILETVSEIDDVIFWRMAATLVHCVCAYTRAFGGS